MSNNKNDELKPINCPFCGSSNVGFVGLLNAVLCDGCDTAVSKNPYKPNEGIIKQWNTRSTTNEVTSPQVEEALKYIDTLEANSWSGSYYIDVIDKIKAILGGNTNV
jgi:hypothetical protein